MAGIGLSKSAKVTVREAPESDIGLGRARIDEATRRLLRVQEGDVIEIEGKRRTVAMARNLLPEEEGERIIRVDGLVRENAKVSPGDNVVIHKAFVSPAEEVGLAPIISEGHKISFSLGIENFVKRGLLKRPMIKGDTVIVPGIMLGGRLPFIVLYTKPEGAIQVDEATIVTLREEPFRKLELLSPEDLVREFVDRVTDKLSALLTEFGGELDKLSGKPGHEASALKDKIREFLEVFRTKEHL